MLVEFVTLKIESLEIFGLIDPVLDHILCHEAASFFCVEADELVPARCLLFEYGLDDGRIEYSRVDCFEVLVRCQVYDGWLFVRRQFIF